MAVGHLDLVIESVKELFESTTTSEMSSHSSIQFVKKFVLDHSKIVLYSIGILAFVGSAQFVFRRWRESRLATAAYLLVSLGLLVVVYSFVDQYWSLVYLSLGFSYLVILAILVFADRVFEDKEANTQRLLAFLTGLTLLLLSVGSDTGAKVAVFGLIVSFPVALWGLDRFFSQISDRRIYGFEVRELLRLGLLLFLVFSLCFGLYVTYSYSGRDSTNRFRMASRIDHAMLKGIYTTPERAAVVEGMLGALSNYVEPGDVLFAFESLPMVHFITRTLPYLSNPWPILFVGDEMQDHIDQALKEYDTLPVVLLAKGNTREADWPLNDTLCQSDVCRHNRAVVDRFLGRFNYRTVWQNDFFRILTSAETLKK